MARLKAILLSILVASAASACVATAPATYGDGSSSLVQKCRDFKTVITVDGTQQDATGRACQQPDGTWTMTSAGAPGDPPQVIYVQEPPPPMYYYRGPFYGPGYYFGPPIIGFGFGYYHRHYW